MTSYRAAVELTDLDGHKIEVQTKWHATIGDLMETIVQMNRTLDTGVTDWIITDSHAEYELRKADHDTAQV